MLYLASFSPVHIRTTARILVPRSDMSNWRAIETQRTNAVSTRAATVAFRPKLVALVASPTYPSPYRPRVFDFAISDLRNFVIVAYFIGARIVRIIP